MQMINMMMDKAVAMLVCLVVGLTCATVNAEVKFPFPAQVTEDVALVRAGVGTTYYVVKKLKKGAVVTVEQKIYQWYKIVPPHGVHSYVSKAFVDAKGDGNVGVVNKTPCEVFTASVNGVADSFRRTTNLLKGDTVQIVAQDGGYYKIMPPKGTYVYIPSGAVKAAEFKPAQSTPLPAWIAAPKSKPVLPVATVVTLKAPQLTLPTTVSSSSTSKPVTISNDAPRQLVIRKPQPGDDLPLIAKSVPVVVTPQQSPRVASAVVGRASSATPPIPDTETPPVYTNWPLIPTAASATSSHSTPDSGSMRELVVDKLVIDKPVVRNRLDGPAPVKPALPQVPAMTPVKSTPPMPRFPNKMPQVTVATTSAEINTLPPIAAPPEASPEVAPEVAPVVVDVPVVVTVPTVNPLLASRGHFQPQSTMLSDLEQRLIDAHQLPLNQRPLAKMLAAYQAVAKQSQLPIRDQRIVQARMVQLKRDIRLNHALNKISSAQTSISGSTPFSQSFTAAPPVAAANAPWVPAHFDIVGQLLVSAVYDGQNLPRLYRLVNPADGRVTLAYIRPNDQINPSVHLGRVVGILGKPEMDQTLRLNVIAPQKIVIFQVAP